MSSATAEAPQDSVLRRHWLAAREQNSGTSHTTSQSSAATSGGFFAWLKSLFS